MTLTAYKRSASLPPPPRARITEFWRKKGDISECLISHHPTRGRPQFHTGAAQTRAGSPGVFSTFEHIVDPYVPSKDPAQFARSSSVTPVSHPQPFRCSSSNPGVFERGASYERSASVKSARGYNDIVRLNPRATNTIDRDAHPNPIVDVTSPHGTSCPVSVALLLRPRAQPKSEEQKVAEQVQRHVRKAIAVRYSRVPGEKNMLPPDMRRAPHDGLRVVYHDRGRKMTVSALTSPPQQKPAPKGQIFSMDELQYVMDFLTPDDQLAASRAFNVSMPHYTMGPLKALREAEAVLTEIPAAFFSALRELSNSPPQLVLFTLHVIVLILEPNCTVVPLPPMIVWPAVKELLRNEPDIVSRIIKTKLQSVTVRRAERVRVMVFEQCMLNQHADENHDHQNGALCFADAARKVCHRVSKANASAGALIQWVVAFLSVHEAVVTRGQADSNPPAAPQHTKSDNGSTPEVKQNLKPSTINTDNSPKDAPAAAATKETGADWSPHNEAKERAVLMLRRMQKQREAERPVGGGGFPQS